jgi:hypothetical protein
MEGEEPKLPAVRSIAWLDGGRGFMMRAEQDRSGKDGASAAWQTMNQNREKKATSKWAWRSDDFRECVALTSTLGLSAFFLGARTTI